MTRTMNMKRVIGGIAVAAGLTLEAACNDAATPTESDAGQATAPVITTIKLSETHLVSFLDLGEGEVGITETLDPETDADAPLKLRGMNLSGLSASAVYQRFSGRAQDASALAKLRQLDVRAADRDRQSALSVDVQALIDADASLNDGDTGSEVSSPRLGTLPTSAESGIAQQKQALCSEPSWDWDGDDAWFSDNFCGASPVRCVARVSGSSGGFHRGGWFTATGFAQSFCGSASWVVKKKTYAGFPSYGITVQTIVNATIAARYLRTFALVNISSSHAYYAQVDAQQGSSFVGFAYDHD
jgi:hypothetical protein